MLFLIHGSRATYHIGWSDESARTLNLHNLLMWRAITELKRRQICWLDLGGINTDALAGISRFKIGTGGQAVVLAGTFL
jgi:lipid II:glycine glycyltransferase (peptidoglycan interpeptide bridge formation enzyme)